jgi:hypothetical protein
MIGGVLKPNEPQEINQCFVFTNDEKYQINFNDTFKTGFINTTYVSKLKNSITL